MNTTNYDMTGIKLPRNSYRVTYTSPRINTTGKCKPTVLLTANTFLKVTHTSPQIKTTGKCSPTVLLTANTFLNLPYSI